METERAIVFDIVETVSDAIARVGRIAFRIHRLIAARLFGAKEYEGTFAADATVVRTFVAVVGTRRDREVGDGLMIAGTRSITFINRALVALVGAGGTLGLRIR